MTRCETIAEELKAYLDGEVPLDRRVAIRLHLARCPSCREEITAMEGISRDLMADEPNGFDAALRNRLLDSAPMTADSDSELEAPPLWKRRPIQVWAAAALVFLAAFIFYPVTAQYKEAAWLDHRPGVVMAPSAPNMALRSGAGEAPSFQRQEMTKSLNGRMGAPEDSSGSSAPFASVYAPDLAGPGGPPSTPPGGLTAPTMSSQAPAAAGADSHLKQRSAKVEPRAEGVSGDTAQRNVIRNATISVRVQGLEAKSEAVERMVKEAGGFVASNQLSTGDQGLKSAALVVRVPAGGFESFLRAVGKLGEVTAKNVTGEDVTEKVSDEKQAAVVLRSELAQVRKRMGDSEGAWQDEETERQLKIRVAQVEGRLDLLKKLSALAKVEIELTERSPTAIKSGGFISEMGDTGRAAVNSFLNAARIPVLLLNWIAAYAPVWVPLAIGFRYAARARNKHVAAREAREWRANREEALGVGR